MANTTIWFNPIKYATDRINSAINFLHDQVNTPHFREVDGKNSLALCRSLLRGVGFLDDSISNPHLGNIFDRSNDSPLNKMSETLASAYGVKRTYPGTTGTTGLNVPAVMTLACEGEKIGIGRDCHVSVFGGLCHSGARPVYVNPQYDQNLGVLLPPTVADISCLLDKNPDLKAVVLTLPTYHGIMGNVSGIVKLCHSRGVRVMIDEAHGGHFHFLSSLGFPRSAESAGADVVTQSTHKILSTLNQGSLLHLNDLSLARRYEEFQSMGFQSTSFSFPILLSVECGIEQMVMDGENLWSEAVDNASYFAAEASQLSGVKVLDEQVVDGDQVIGIDPTRITLNVQNTGLTGYQVSDELASRGIIAEMATPDVILFLISPSTTKEKVDETLNVLRAIFDSFHHVSSQQTFVPPVPGTQVLTPRQAAMTTNRERVPKHEAIGRICAETIGAYPPGQAILVQGEVVTEEAVVYLEGVVEAGGHLKRIQDDHFQTIEVFV